MPSRKSRLRDYEISSSEFRRGKKKKKKNPNAGFEPELRRAQFIGGALGPKLILILLNKKMQEGKKGRWTTS